MKDKDEKVIRRKGWKTCEKGRIINHYLPLLMLLTVTKYLYKEEVNNNRYLPLLTIFVKRKEWREGENEHDVRRKENWLLLSLLTVTLERILQKEWIRTVIYLCIRKEWRRKERKYERVWWIVWERRKGTIEKGKMNDT